MYATGHGGPVFLYLRETLMRSNLALAGFVLLVSGCTPRQEVQFLDPCSKKMVTGEDVGVMEVAGGAKYPRVRFEGRDYVLLGTKSVSLGWQCEDLMVSATRKSGDTLNVSSDAFDSAYARVYGQEALR